MDDTDTRRTADSSTGWRGRAEARFGVGTIDLEGRRTVASMLIDERHAVRGRTSLGSLGVLVDIVLGFALIKRRPPGHWSVSCEIAIDAVPTLPPPGTTVSIEAETDFAGATEGLATGWVVTEDGSRVALAMQRARFVPWAEDHRFDSRRQHAPSSSACDGLAELLDAELTAAGEAILPPDPAWQNPLHNLHGGVALATSCLAADRALEELCTREGRPALVPRSIRVNYVRPIPADRPARFSPHLRHLGRTFGVVDVEGIGARGVSTLAHAAAHPVC